MKFTLEIACYNTAFTDPDNGDHEGARNMEVAYILRGVSAQVDEGFLAGLINDSNGNFVGVFKFFEE